MTLKGNVRQTTLLDCCHANSCPRYSAPCAFTVEPKASIIDDGSEFVNMHDVIGFWRNGRWVGHVCVVSSVLSRWWSVDSCLRQGCHVELAGDGGGDEGGAEFA